MNNKILAIAAIVLAITLTLAAGMVATGTLTEHRAFARAPTLTTPGQTVTLPREGDSGFAIRDNVINGAPCEAFEIDENPILLHCPVL